MESFRHRPWRRGDASRALGMADGGLSFCICCDRGRDAKGTSEAQRTPLRGQGRLPGGGGAAGAEPDGRVWQPEVAWRMREECCRPRNCLSHGGEAAGQHAVCSPGSCGERQEGPVLLCLQLLSLWLPVTSMPQVLSEHGPAWGGGLCRQEQTPHPPRGRRGWDWCPLVQKTGSVT